MQMFHTKLSALPHSTAQALGSQVVVSNVSKSYGADAFAKQVVHNCSFTIERGKLTVMIGPSGCGKSTLIAIAGFERPAAEPSRLTTSREWTGVDRLVVPGERAVSLDDHLRQYYVRPSRASRGHTRDA